MGAQPIRIVSYNVRYFGHALRGLASTAGAMQRIGEAVRALSPLPDLICLQEVETGSLRSTVAHKGARLGHRSQLEAFMHLLEESFSAAKSPFPYEAYYFRAHAYLLREVPIYTTGLAVLVNLHTLRVGGHNVAAPHPITHHHVERWRNAKQSRICAHLALADAGNRKFHVFNTHLSLPTPFHRHFWSNRAKMGYGVNQLEEAHTLARFLQEEAGGEPLVVCGDFNASPGSPVWRFLTEEQGLVDPQVALEQIDPGVPRGYPTAGFMRMRMHLDHLFAGGPVEWLDLEGSRPFDDPENAFQGLSDHVPLMARFRLT